MSTFIDRYSTSLIVVISIALGFFLPEVGVLWKQYLTFLLMLLMFFVTLNIQPSELSGTIRNYRLIGTGLFTVFVLTPVLSLLTKPFFSPTIYAGIVLALCCPSAIVSAFWAKIFRGDTCTALVMSVVTNLLSIITIPATMLLAIGTAINLDVLGMMINLTEIVLVPMAASFLLRKFIHTDWDRAANYGSKLGVGILALVIWGSVSAGVRYVTGDITEFMSLNAFLFGTLAIAFTLTHLLTRRFGKERAISLDISTTVKNAALSLVIGLSVFDPQITPPLIANLIAQNLLLIPAKALTQE
jgi:BASS family bile acid:Na+ symporter